MTVFIFSLYIAPSALRDVNITQKSSRSLRIKWKSPLQPNGVITYYQITIIGRVNRSLIIPTTDALKVESSTIIDDLTPYTPYALKIRAGIHFGGDMLWGEFSKTIHFVTDKEGKLNSI